MQTPLLELYNAHVSSLIAHLNNYSPPDTPSIDDFRDLMVTTSKLFRDKQPTLSASTLSGLSSSFFSTINHIITTPTKTEPLRLLLYETLGALSSLLAFDSSSPPFPTKQPSFPKVLHDLYVSIPDSVLRPRMLLSIGYLMFKSRGIYSQQALPIFRFLSSVISSQLKSSTPTLTLLSSALRCYSLSIGELLQANTGLSTSSQYKETFINVLTVLDLINDDVEVDSVHYHCKVNALCAVTSCVKGCKHYTEWISELLPSVSHHQTVKNTPLSRLLLSDSAASLKVLGLELLSRILTDSSRLLKTANDTPSQSGRNLSFISKSANLAMVVKGTWSMLNCLLKINLSTNVLKELLKTLHVFTSVVNFYKFFDVSSIQASLFPALFDILSSNNNFFIFPFVLPVFSSLFNVFRTEINTCLIYSKKVKDCLFNQVLGNCRVDDDVVRVACLQFMSCFVCTLHDIDFELQNLFLDLYKFNRGKSTEDRYHLLKMITHILNINNGSEKEQDEDQKSSKVWKILVEDCPLTDLFVFDEVSTISLIFEIFGLIPVNNVFDSSEFSLFSNFDNLKIIVNHAISHSTPEVAHNHGNSGLITSSIKVLGILIQLPVLYSDPLIVFQIIQNVSRWFSEGKTQSVLIPSAITLGNISSVFPKIVTLDLESHSVSVLSECFFPIISLVVNLLSVKSTSDRVRQGLIRSVGLLSTVFSHFLDERAPSAKVYEVFKALKFSFSVGNAKTKWNVAYSAAQLLSCRYVSTIYMTCSVLRSHVSELFLTLMKAAVNNSNFKVRTNCLKALFANESITKNFQGEILCICYLNMAFVAQNAHNSMSTVLVDYLEGIKIVIETFHTTDEFLGRLKESIVHNDVELEVEQQSIFDYLKFV
ncbi:hypothetical protein P9112_002193 [Eukaryota sp. TZLM1-RC]